MKANNKYGTKNIESATQNVQRTLHVINKKTLPTSDQEMGYYVKNLMASDLESLRTIQEQDVCDNATD